MSPTWLVTGGCGFIGSHLTEALLARGDRVRILDDLSTGREENCRPNAELIRGCVTDTALVRRAMDGPEGCFHLAAIASVMRCNEDVVASHRVNQGGTLAVLDAARRLGGGRVVYASSAAVYGATERPALSEHHPSSPVGPYGADKRGSELHASAARICFGVPSLGLRFFNVYGPRQDGTSPYSGVISCFLARITAGRALMIRGDGRQTRDFVHVKDVVRALLAGMDRLPGTPEVLNVCTGHPTSVRQLADTLADMLRRKLRIEYAPSRTGDVRSSTGDPSLLQRHLQVQAAIGLSEGLRSLLGPHESTKRRREDAALPI